MTNQEILAEINDELKEESDGQEENPNEFEPINKPGIEDAREALQVLEGFSQSSLDSKELSHKKQSIITSFFQSNRFEFREEYIFIFLTHPFSTRAPNKIFKYAQILAT